MQKVAAGGAKAHLLHSVIVRRQRASRGTDSMRTRCYWGHTFLPELIRSDGMIFDFGTYNGGFCKVVAPLCQRVIGFEPDPYWEGRLSLPENVRVFPKALAAKRGVLRFNLNKEKCASAHYFDKGARSIEVDAITLADALALVLTPAERIELIKMDIEGEELAVLRDASPESLQRIAQLTVEFHDFLDRGSVPAIRTIIEKMRSLGFFAMRFSWHSYGDLLFVNQRLEPLSLWQRVGLIVFHKYARGFGRIARRALRLSK
jgi:FkbM family methyltransferase